MGALESAPLSFLFPCGLYLGAVAQKKVSAPSISEKVVQYVICGVSVLLMVMGTIAAIRGIVENASSFGVPFDCFCDASPSTCCASGFHPVGEECCVPGPSVYIVNSTNTTVSYIKTDGVGVPCQ